MYSHSGEKIACGIVGAPEELTKLASVQRVGKNNCKNLYAIKNGSMKGTEVHMAGKKVHEKVEILRSMPILNEHNCKHTSYLH